MACGTMEDFLGVRFGEAKANLLISLCNIMLCDHYIQLT